MFREGLRPPDPFQEKDPLEAARTQDGMSLKTLGELSPVLIVLLPSRPRKMLEQLEARRAAIEKAGTRIVIVFAAPPELEKHDLQYLARIEDKERKLYRHFGLEEKKRLLGGTAQEGGVFLLEGGEVRPSVLEGPG